MTREGYDDGLDDLTELRDEVERLRADLDLSRRSLADTGEAYEEVMDEVNALKVEVERLRVACDTFSKNETIFIREEARRTRERDEAQEERDALKAEVKGMLAAAGMHQTVREEHDSLKLELEAEKFNHRKDNEHLVEERDSLKAEVEGLQEQNDGWHERRLEWAKERDALKAASGWFEFEREVDKAKKLEEERDAFKAENEVLLVTVRQQREERDAALNELDDARVITHLLRQDRNALRAVVTAARELWTEMDDISVRPPFLENFRRALEEVKT